MNSVPLNDLKYADIRIGDSAHFRIRITEDLVQGFVELTGDRNPLHCDEVYAAATPFGGRIVHGMLLAGFFSTLVGMHYPGRFCLYLSQDIEFRKPAHIGEELIVRGTAVAKSDATKIVEIKTEITNQEEELVVSGRARVRLLA